METANQGAANTSRAARGISSAKNGVGVSCLNKPQHSPDVYGKALGTNEGTLGTQISCAIPN